MQTMESRENSKPTAPKRLTEEELVTLSKQMETGDHSARERIILSHISLVRYLANIFASRSPGDLYEDLYQEGCVGLVEATQRFDYRRGVPFSSYASYYIVKHIKNYIRKQDTIVLPEDTYYQLQRYYRFHYDTIRQKGRLPTLPELSQLLIIPEAQVEQLQKYAYNYIRIDHPKESSREGEQLFPETLHSFLRPKDGTQQPVEEQAERDFGELDLIDLDVELTEREVEVLRRKFGLASNEPETFAAIAKDLGFSSECIRLAYHKAISKIRLAAKKQGYTMERFPLS